MAAPALDQGALLLSRQLKGISNYQEMLTRLPDMLLDLCVLAVLCTSLVLPCVITKLNDGGGRVCPVLKPV